MNDESTAGRGTRLRRLAVVAGLVLVSSAGAGVTRAGSAGAATAASTFTKTETITRTHLIDGADVVADTRHVTVTVSATKDIRDRQAVTVTWKGAHPTGGLVFDHNSAAAAQQEYPVVVMQCRGIDSPNAPADQQVSPETCWTQTPAERFQYSRTGTIFPSYRMDRYAPSSERTYSVDAPDPLPADCSPVVAPRWVPFIGADKVVYPGGNLGCAGMAPEAANAADSLQPGSTTYGVANAKGDGSTKFVMQEAESNASLGCSATVACTLEVIPIMGISCDSAGTAAGTGHGLPTGQRPPASLVGQIQTDCGRSGKFAPGDFNGGGGDTDLPVTGSLWWSASNWRNRVSAPLTFAPSAGVCDVVTNDSSAYLYGSEALAQATQQWSPSFCLDPKLFTLRHVQTSETQAKNLLNAGTIEAAIQAGPPDTPFVTPTVQAPAAVSGFAIAYGIDGADGAPYPGLKLDARLIAKLMSESYEGCALDCVGFPAIANNPIDMSRDPEFQALNPGIPITNYLQSAATLEFMSSDSDIMHALTSYLNADPEARAWLDGRPDPWGMVVNPAYKKIALPLDSWPLLDTHVAHLATGANQCLSASPVPWMPLVASPVSNPATVALHLQFDIANSQTNCKNNGEQNQKLTAIGREAPGSRFVLGLVSVADAARYQLDEAALQSTVTSGSGAKFTGSSGRTFVAPTEAGLRTAAARWRPDDALGTWPVSYGALRTSAGAYPGTVLISIDVPTSGLLKADAANLAKLLRFVAGPGQTPGLGNGQLAAGYVALSSADGLGNLSAYTRKAADAVAAQQGHVPFVSGKITAPPTGTTPRSSAAPTSGGSGSQASGGSGTGSSNGAVGTGGSGGAVTTPTGASRSTPKPAPSTSSPTPGSTVNAVPVARTRRLDAGPLGLALPALALMALVALSAGALSGGVRRR